MFNDFKRNFREAIFTKWSIFRQQNHVRRDILDDIFGVGDFHEMVDFEGQNHVRPDINSKRNFWGDINENVYIKGYMFQFNHPKYAA